MRGATIVTAAALVGVTLLASADRAAAGPSVTMMADSCAVCHGTDGRSVSKIDRLAGMSRRELVEEMNEMLVEPHEGRLMGVVAKGFTAEEIRALGRYFERLGDGTKKGEEKRR